MPYNKSINGDRKSASRYFKRGQQRSQYESSYC